MGEEELHPNPGSPNPDVLFFYERLAALGTTGIELVDVSLPSAFFADAVYGVFQFVAFFEKQFFNQLEKK